MIPCPLAIWNLLFGMAILLNLVKIIDHRRRSLGKASAIAVCCVHARGSGHDAALVCDFA